MAEGAGPVPAYVLDSYALLAYLQGEPGGGRVVHLLREAEAGRSRLFLSILNLGEVLYLVERRRGLRAAQAVLANIYQLPVARLPVTEETVLAAAHLKAHHPIAYADAFAVAAAQAQQAALVTGDPEFRAVEGIVTLEWLPEVNA